jgi:hypothetical protein
VQAFGVEHIRNGIDRPTIQPNAWVADFADEAPCVTMEWDTEQTIGSLELAFDTDFDHPMESVLMGHPERVMPFCVRNYNVEDGQGRVLYTKEGNYATRNRIVLSEQVRTNRLLIRCQHPSPEVPASIFSIRCFE